MFQYVHLNQVIYEETDYKYIVLSEFHLPLYCEYASKSCTEKLIKYECWPIFLTPYLPKPHVHN